MSSSPVTTEAITTATGLAGGFIAGKRYQSFLESSFLGFDDLSRG